MLNKVVLIGRLAKKPELRYTPSGNVVAGFTLAVERPYSQNGDKETDFIPIVAWGKLGENAANYLSKGRLTSVEGRIQIRSYENNEGRRVYVTEVVAETIKFLEKPNKRDESKNNDPFKDDSESLNINESDLPF